MKMNHLLWNKTAVALIILTLIFSCSDEDVTTQQDAAMVTDETITDYYFEDTDDLVGLVMLADDGTSTGGRIASSRVITVADQRFNCPEVVITITIDSESTTDVPKGEIIIDFGSGCTDAQGTIRKGKLIINYQGKRFLPGSIITTQYQNYIINEVKLEGTRTLTNISASSLNAPKFRIELANGRVVWPDGTFSTREHCFVRTWLRAANPLNDAMVVEPCEGNTFTAAGINRNGKEYQMTILEPIHFKRGCPIAVKGVKQFIDKKTGKVLLVNYGNGECDRSISLTIDGTTRAVEVRKRN
jgi:hypothetical protein